MSIGKRHFFLSVAWLFLLSVTAPNCFGIEWVVSYGGKIRSAAIDRHYLSLAQRDEIHIFDINNERAIRKVGSMQFEGNPIDELAVKWPVIYFVEHETGNIWQGVRAIDASVPSQPHLLKLKHDGNFFPVTKTGLNIKIISNKLFVLAERSKVYDITNPLQPVEMEQDGSETNRLKEAASSSPTPQKPSILAQIPQGVIFSGIVDQVLAQGHLVYLKNSDGALETLDVTNPRMPKDVGPAKQSQAILSKLKATVPVQNKTLPLHDPYQLKAVYEESNNDQDGYFSGEKIKILDLSKPDTPKEVATLMGINHSHRDRFEGFLLAGNIVFVFTSYSNTAEKRIALSAFDLSDLRKPKFLGSYPKILDIQERFDQLHRGFAELPRSVSVAGDMIFVADHEEGLAILRFTKNQQESTAKPDGKER